MRAREKGQILAAAAIQKREAVRRWTVAKGGALSLCVALFAMLWGGDVLGSPNWTLRTGGDVPYDAVVGGNDSDGTPLYICRGTYSGGTYPGRLRAEFGGCNIPFGGKEVTLPYYEVLVPSWAGAVSGTIPFNAVEFGVEPYGHRGYFGRLLYICRAIYDGGLYPGKLRAEFGGCSIAYGGREIIVRHYEVMVHPDAFPMLKVPTSRGRVPPDAIIGGREGDGEPLAVCSAPFRGGLHPGKVRSEFGGCNISYGGGDVTIPNYQVLTPEWQNRSRYRLNFPAGSEHGDPLYICRARYSGGTHPGKFSPATGCRFGFGGQEFTATDYDLLTSPIIH